MKIIFLDVDGVLNNIHTMTRTASGCCFVEKECLKMVRHIVLETGAKVVLSSDWRYDRDDPKYNQDFLELKDIMEKYNIPIFDYTPIINWELRGVEIAVWLGLHPKVDSFVILDDRNDMSPYKEQFIKTNFDTSLTDELTEKAIRILNESHLV